MKSREAQFYKGLADLAVLTALSRGRRYGLELLNEMTLEAGLKLGEGTIYPLLHRLAQDRLVKAEWRIDTPNGRPRKYYEITKAGRDALQKMIASWREIRTHLDKYLEGRANDAAKLAAG